MFKILGANLQGVVCSVVKGAKKARSFDSKVFIKASKKEGVVSFFFNGEEVSPELKVECEIQEDIDITTTTHEIDVKVGVLPKDEVITVEKSENTLYLKWGRSSYIIVATFPDKSPMIDIPEVVEEVTWKSGALSGLTRALTPFCAKLDEVLVKDNPTMIGVNFARINEVMDEDQEFGVEGEKTTASPSDSSSDDNDTEVDENNENSTTGNEVIVRATTGYKAVRAVAEGIGWFKKPGTISSNSLQTLCEVLPETELKVGINKEGSILVFRAGLTTAIVRLLNGNFHTMEQNYTDDEEATVTWTFDRMEIVKLCKRIKLLATTMEPKEKYPPLIIRHEGSKVFTELPGVSKEQIGALAEGKEDPFDFTVNAIDIELAFSLFEAEEVQLLASEKTKALTIACEDNNDIKAIIGQVRNRK